MLEMGDVGHMPRKAAQREWSKPKMKMLTVGSKAGGEVHLSLTKLKSQTWDIVFGVCSAGLLSCFGSGFLHYAAISPFGDDNACFAPLLVGSM